MTEPLWVPRDAFENGTLQCPGCGRQLRPDAQTHYLVNAGRPEAIGAALVHDSCNTSIRLWFRPRTTAPSP